MMTVLARQSDVVERKAAPHVKSVLLIDNYPVVALGLELAFRSHPGLFLVKKVSEPAVAIPAIAECSPDAIVLDPVFGGAVHFSLIQEVRAAMAPAIIVVFSSLPAAFYERAALAAGADFFLGKDHDCRDLVGILTGPFSKTLSPGIRPASKAIKVCHPVSSLSWNYEAHLTPREHEVAALLSRGLSVAEIAHLIGTSRKTVCVHRDNLRIKLRCRDSTELVVRLAWLQARAMHAGANPPPGSPVVGAPPSQPVPA